MIPIGKGKGADKPTPRDPVSCAPRTNEEHMSEPKDIVPDSRPLGAKRTGAKGGLRYG